MIVLNATHKKVILRDAWESRTSNMLNIIGLVESWMIMEETWYIKPSIINGLSQERRNIIADDVRYSQAERQLWESYDVSIFDEIREKYLQMYKLERILPVEREKQELMRLNNLPIRKSRDERERNMQEKMMMMQFYEKFE